MKIDDIIKSMESKLDETNKGLIADDFANLIQYGYDSDNNLKDKNDKIEKLQSEKEKLLIANGNLLQKVSMEKEEVLNPKNEEPKEDPKEFNFASLFVNGNWKN